MDVIGRYSREDAINDGVLVDITDTKEAKEAGFKIPVCLTQGVHDLVAVPEALERSQDYTGRLWDTVYMATLSFKAMKATGATEHGMRIVPFKVIYAIAEDKQEAKDLWLVFNASEGFTIMLPEEY